jgi:hypothetical protein
MKILKVYKELRDVVIFEDDNGNVLIRAMFEDEGTLEEQEVVKQMVATDGFKPTNRQQYG